MSVTPYAIHSRQFVFVWLFAWLLLTGQGIAQDQAAFAALKSGDAITIVEGVRPVLTYQKAVRAKEGRWPRNHYIHPLYDLDGNSITEDFPVDHGHHRGIFWTWHQVVIDGKRIGDAWLCKDFQWDVRRFEATRQHRFATLTTEVDWKSPQYIDDQGQPIAFVREKAKIVIHAAQPNFRCVDFDLHIKAIIKGVEIGGSADSKGYGGFSPRIRLEKDFRFTAAGGSIEPTKNAIDAGPWVNIANDRTGFAMMSHPQNPEPKHSWILRSRDSMQNAAYPGRNPIALDPKAPWHLRYRIVIHRGDLSAESLAKLYEDYATDQ
ncbi:MAG: DUF6807 family protein [Aureliella sp.]